LLILICLGLLVIPSLAAATRCLLPQLPRLTEDYEVIRTRLEAEGLWHPTGEPSRRPPADPQVGDTWLWYIWDLGGYPTATLKPCTVRGMGDHCYVVIDDEEWNVSVNQDDVDAIVLNFNIQSIGDFPEQGIWDLNTSHFGEPPNPLDGLERIFLLYYRFNISADGYFWIYDQFPDGSQPFHSNEADVVYLASDNNNTGSPYMLGVAAHEFEHMIHFNQDSNENTWVDEGLAELAMWLFGNPDNISGFNVNPDNSLIAWNGLWADYIKTYLWSLYIYEQYGGQPTIWEVTHHPANGMAGYLMALTDLGYVVTMEDIFGDWAVANFLDDTSVPDGQYGYNGDDLPPFLAYRTHNIYPATASGSVQNWAAEYIRLLDFEGAPTLDFNGNDLRDFRLAMLARDPVLPSLVHFVPLDEINDGYYAFTEAAGYAEVIIAVSNVYPTAGAIYVYTVGSVPTAVSESPATPVVLQSYPNPFNPATELQFSLGQKGHVCLSIFDARGHRVAQLVEGDLVQGPHQVTWFAGDLASGLYLAALEVDGQLVSRTKLALVK
jgi:hypothetical protein